MVLLSTGRLHGCRRYDYREVIGRVEPGAETESDAGCQNRVSIKLMRSGKGAITTPP